MARMMVAARARIHWLLASTLLAAACHAPPPPPRTPAELAADIAEALAAGNIERAEDLAERGLQRHRIEPIVQLWSGVVASLRWEDPRAVSLIKAAYASL